MDPVYQKQKYRIKRQEIEKLSTNAMEISDTDDSENYEESIDYDDLDDEPEYPEVNKDTPHEVIFEHIRNGRLPKLNIVFDLDHTLIQSFELSLIKQNENAIKEVNEFLKKGLMKKFDCTVPKRNKVMFLYKLFRPIHLLLLLSE